MQNDFVCILCTVANNYHIVDNVLACSITTDLRLSILLCFVAKHCKQHYSSYLHITIPKSWSSKGEQEQKQKFKNKTKKQNKEKYNSGTVRLYSHCLFIPIFISLFLGELLRL